MRDEPIDLVAGVSVPANIAGRYFSIVTGNGLYTLQTDNGLPKSTVKVGMIYDLTNPATGLGFSTFHLQSDTTETVEVAVSELRFWDNRLAISTTIDCDIVAQSLAALKVKTAPHTSAGNGAITVLSTAALISAAAVNRAELLLQAIDGDIFFSTSPSVTTANGTKISLGGSINITHNLAVYAIAAASVNARWASESD